MPADGRWDLIRVLKGKGCPSPTKATVITKEKAFNNSVLIIKGFRCGHWLWINYLMS
jgi:hypothetical protein